MSDFWSWYIIVIVLANIIGYGLLLHFTGKVKGSGNPEETTGHVYDGIEELNTPMPRWWIFMFWISIVFALVYLFLYPGLGSYKGYLGWTSEGQWQKEVELADKKFGPIYKAYGEQSIEALLQDPKALKIGQRLFGNNCAACHGSDANGSRGFPNLTDHDWLYGGSPEAIETSILHGRSGMMPPMGMALGGDEGVAQVAAYVRSLSGQKVDFSQAEEGKKKFQVMCIACHGVDAKGNTLMGAPNLTDNIWLYGGDAKTVQETIAKGRNGKMPAQKDFLGTDKVHLLAAYVYSLSAQKQAFKK
ncbi:MAG TPA: cytochrome-c oxidase, cbb3-type subunit III [Pseudomonadales bacterium]